uniref:Uncharacterized protein n=1 Tax=Romanomermis culicivorax TaxID=13658 RepID=A0A915LCZ8_ROMCU
MVMCVQIPTAFKTVRDKDDVTLTAAVGTYELKYIKLCIEGCKLFDEAFTNTHAKFKSSLYFRNLPVAKKTLFKKW